jgi:flagellar biosynthesis protein FlhA
MANNLATFGKSAGRFAARHRGLILPITAAAMVLVVLAPLPAGVLDVLLAANIALSALILLSVIHSASPLDFSLFPTVLIGSTLMRLTLNIATTRRILLAGSDGQGASESLGAAGQVVLAFSQFVTAGAGNHLAVGVILFVIIAIIQFVVVTKGAARISEVAARFVLDAMPGKQMAIDADLNAGLVNQEQARDRRGMIAREADFYGAMDGASKFLRGDAIASVLITVVNICGGLYIGRVHNNWGWSDTVDIFTRLTIGEALVMQAPAFIIAVAAALIVTRGSAKVNLGEEVVKQLTARPIALAITAGFLGLLAFTKLPTLPLLIIGASCGGLAWILSRPKANAQAGDESANKSAKPADSGEKIEDVLAVDPMRIELGFSLVKLVDASQGGDLLDRVGRLRKEIAAELGLLVPPIRIIDDLRLDSHLYVIRIRGQKIASGKLYPNQVLAIVGNALPAGHLDGRSATDPLTGAPALWISRVQKEQAEMMNYQVLPPGDVLIRHLGEVIRSHAAELLTRRQVNSLLEAVKGRSGNLVAEATEKLRVGQIQKVLQNLLSERVSIRDIDAVLEAISEAGAYTDQTDALTEEVRASLGRSLSRQYCSPDGKLWCVCLDSELEEAISSQIGNGQTGSAVPPELAERLGLAVSEALAGLKMQGRHPVILCAPQVRWALRKLLSPAMPEAAVLAYNEIESLEVQSTATVGIGL